MNYATIKKTDIANGPGVRVSLFVSGCRHHCKNCFNREAWAFDYGQQYTPSVQEEILAALAPSFITGLSLLGGEPFEPENQAALLGLLEAVYDRYPHKTVWCYSGFTFEELLGGAAGDTVLVRRLLQRIDVLVDGRFEEEKKDLTLRFRGSSNQRILDVKRSLEQGTAVLMDGVWQRTVGSRNIEEDGWL